MKLLCIILALVTAAVCILGAWGIATDWKYLK
jgi:phage-related minor tail protein